MNDEFPRLRASLSTPAPWDEPHAEGVGDLLITQAEFRRTFKNVIVDSVAFRRGYLSFEIQGSDIIHNFVCSDPYTFVFEYRI